MSGYLRPYVRFAMEWDDIELIILTVLALGGGSWADDEVDISSISVPIEKNRHLYHDHDSFGSYGSGYNSYGGGRGSGMYDHGPPYIVKLLSLPVKCDDMFIEDLFQSRFTPYVKFKVLVDPSSNILETGVVKRVAFVELKSFQDMSRVLKWQDLYYMRGRKVIVESADFGDFQHTMQFNKEHEDQINRIIHEYLENRDRLPPASESAYRPPRGMQSPTMRNANLAPRNSPSHVFNDINAPILGANQQRLQPQEHQQQQSQKSDVAKVNPFGNAKPVDVVAKLKELDLKLVHVNNTTIKTLGTVPDSDLEREKEAVRRNSHSGSRPRPSRGSFSTDRAGDLATSPVVRKSSINILKREAEPTQPEQAKVETEGNKSTSNGQESASKFRPAPIPAAISFGAGNGASLADILRNKKDDSLNGENSKGSGRNLKPAKQIILKKKPLSATPPIDLTLKESNVVPVEETVEKVLSEDNYSPAVVEVPVTETKLSIQNDDEEKSNEKKENETEKSLEPRERGPRRKPRRNEPRNNERRSSIEQRSDLFGKQSTRAPNGRNPRNNRRKDSYSSKDAIGTETSLETANKKETITSTTKASDGILAKQLNESPATEQKSDNTTATKSDIDFKTHLKELVEQGMASKHTSNHHRGRGGYRNGGSRDTYHSKGDGEEKGDDSEKTYGTRDRYIPNGARHVHRYHSVNFRPRPGTDTYIPSNLNHESATEKTPKEVADSVTVANVSESTLQENTGFNSSSVEGTGSHRNGEFNGRRGGRGGRGRGRGRGLGFRGGRGGQSRREGGGESNNRKDVVVTEGS